jgi:hypothetical protein
LNRFDLLFGRLAYIMSLAVAGVTLLSGWLYFHQHRDVIDGR